MKVILYAADEGGCSYVRCEQPLRTSGADGEVRTNVMVQTIRQQAGGPVRRRVDPVDADVVVFQRPPHKDTIMWIEQFQAQGVAVVVDVDDDLKAVHPRNVSYALHNGLASPYLNARFTSRCCQLADLVTVSTPALAERYGGHGRVAVLENCVPEKILDYPAVSDGRTLGWAGRVATHPGDLEATHGGVGEALGDWRFHVIGEATSVRDKLRLPCEPSQTPWINSVDDYHLALGKLDVGIAPLGDTAFNASKSWLKAIEQAGRGVPFVASKRAEYERLGLGVLVPDRARSWRAAVRRLITDETLRTELVEQGRETVRERHTYERNGHLWGEAWSQAVSNSLRRRAAAA